MGAEKVALEMANFPSLRERRFFPLCAYLRKHLDIFGGGSGKEVYSEE